MALQSFQIDPDHAHRYRKIMKLGVDDDSTHASPQAVDLVDSGDVWVTDGGEVNAVGLRTRWRKTGPPE